MKKKIFKIHSLIIPFLMAAVVGVLNAVPTEASGVTVDATVTDEETIKIKDVEDLLEFAENCTLDAWSRGKTVVLQADIYLDEVDFEPIPTFGGTFDGKGHSVIGLEVTSSVSPAGLFGVLQEGAVVKNLNVTGNITPSGENSAVGGIVGENYGEIRNSTFTGTVSGSANVGGIVGINGYTGEIENCRVSGVVLGASMTGGVAGYNQGTLLKCKNDADVNNVSVDAQISIDNIDLDISLDVTQWSSAKILDTVSDSGGIAGYSIGIIQSCSNAGTVGYPHIGYNLGGIAGRSCGYIADCINAGEIYGRKDAGGIVGQMEPYIYVELSESGVAQIQGELATLDGLMTSAESHSEASTATLQKRVWKVQSYLENIQGILDDTAESAKSNEAQEITQNGQLAELKEQMDLLMKQLQLLRNEAAGSAGTLGQDIQNITGQAGRLSDTFKSVMQEAENASVSDYVTDISGINLEEATFGKVVSCTNNKTVYADRNVGGIAGNMSLEYELDPEDDVTVELSMKEKQQYKLTTIIYKCVNNAAVTSKKNYAGGICGRMDLGLISDGENYGYVSSEGGDYVGGIAGLTASTVQNCFVKCSLSGRNYIGGIVGTGVTEDTGGESSLVSKCYSLVEILGYQQFAGSIAGVNAGQYMECYFVSQDMPGINRISYADMAEPITYDELLEVKGLPEEFEVFMLSFVANGQVVYAATFEYGDSFEKEDFPAVPAVNGMQGRWEVQELSNLQKDTVVTAVYNQNLTAIASAEVREDGRSVFMAEGQFGEDGGIVAEERKIVFDPTEELSFLERLNETEVIEQWSIEIPDDGLLIHTLRYLPPENDTDSVDIYIKQNGEWKLADRNPVGSYLLFHIAGTEAEIAVVTMYDIWWLWAIGVALIIIMIGGGIWGLRKKKDILKWIIGILAVVLIAVAVLAAWVLLDGKLVNSIGAYQLLEEYLAQPEQALKLEMEAEIGDEKYKVEADVLCTQPDGQPITCVEIGEARFFYADGVLYLENGNAYQASEVSADYGSMLKQIAALYEVLDVETVKEETGRIYKITVQEGYAQDILTYLLPTVSEDALEMQTLEAELAAEDDVLDSIVLTSKGKLHNEEKIKYDITASLSIVETDDIIIEIPENVKTAINSGTVEIQAIITSDVFRLYHAWEKLEEQSLIGAQIYLSADCGPLTLDEELTFISSLADGTRINCVQKDHYSVYFNEDTICSEKGYSVTAKRAAAVDAAELLSIAYKLCLEGTFRCTEVNGAYIYSIVLDENGMKEVAALISKESADMGILFENGSLQLVIKNDELESIRFACDGEVDILLTTVAVALSAEMEMKSADNFLNYSIPEKVLEKLTE